MNQQHDEDKETRSDGQSINGDDKSSSHQELLNGDASQVNGMRGTSVEGITIVDDSEKKEEEERQEETNREEDRQPNDSKDNNNNNDSTTEKPQVLSSPPVASVVDLLDESSSDNNGFGTIFQKSFSYDDLDDQASPRERESTSQPPEIQSPRQQRAKSPPQRSLGKKSSSAKRAITHSPLQQLPKVHSFSNLPKRSQSMKENFEKRQAHQEEQRRQRRLTTKSYSPSNHRNHFGNISEHSRNSTDDDDDGTDDGTLMLIAKARAAMGDEFVLRQSGDNNNNTNNNNNDGDQKRASMNSDQDSKRRGRRPDDAHELQRPGAYSKSPGEEFRRNSTFEKDRAYKPHPCNFKSTTSGEDGFYKNDHSHKSLPKTATATATKPNVEDDENDLQNRKEEDRKPAAVPSKVSPRRAGRRKGQQVRVPRAQRVRSANENDHKNNTVGDESAGVRRSSTVDSGAIAASSTTTSNSRPGRMARDEKMAAAVDHDDDLDNSEQQNHHVAKAVASFQRVHTGESSRPSLRMSALTMTTKSSLRSSSLMRDSQNLNNTSIISWASSLSNLTSTDNSDQIIADVAEQSVANFVRTYTSNIRQRQETIRRQQTVEAIPIDAQVVPSEEEIETMIRSRLEEELRTHLTQELISFRQQLLQEIILRNDVQVADPVTASEELASVAEHLAMSTVSGATASGHDNSYNTEELQLLPTGIPEWRGTENLDNRPVSSSAPELGFNAEDTPDDAEVEGGSIRAPTAPVQSIGRFRRRQRPMLGDSFTQSIRQSIRHLTTGLAEEFNNLEGAVVEEAQVISSSVRDDDLEAQAAPRNVSLSTAPNYSHTSAANSQLQLRSMTSTNGGEEEVYEEQAQAGGKVARQFTFSSRGLLSCLFAMFLLGAFVGAGAAILAMGSLGD